MKNKKIRIISFMLLMAMVIGIIPVGLMKKSYASKGDFMGVKQVSAGGSHTMFLKEDGTVRATGRNYNGQLGLGDDGEETNRGTPTKVDIENVKQVSAGHRYTMLLKEDGTVWATGDNYGDNGDGQLGLGDTKDRNIPTKVDIENVKEVTTGYNHTMFLKEDGTVWATGSNGSGQLGLGGSKRTPTKVDIENVKQVSAGNRYTMLLKEDGTVWATGDNGDGQLGLGDTKDRNTPTKVDIENVKQVSSGEYHTIFLKEDGTVWATGSNADGELGLGDTNKRNIPTRVDIENVEQVSAGNRYTIFLKRDGTVWATGGNYYGQLGLGDKTNRNIPTKVNIENIKQVSAGHRHTIFLKRDGAVWATGSDEKGELGLSGFGRKYTPTINFYLLFDSKYSIDSIYNLPEAKEYGSWADRYYGKDFETNKYRAFNNSKTELFSNIIDSDQIKTEKILPNGWVITIDNYGMINWYKTFSSDQPDTISFDGRKVNKIELGHIQGIGLAPLLYTNDGFIHYIDLNDNQVRMLPVFQNEIKGTMV
jgi:alpha-tubulin suppressor-like RCC1 family protein